MGTFKAGKWLSLFGSHSKECAQNWSGLAGCGACGTPPLRARCWDIPKAFQRTDKPARKLGGAAKSSYETPVSSAEHPYPKDEGTGNTAEARPHPDGARNPPPDYPQPNTNCSD